MAQPKRINREGNYRNYCDGCEEAVTPEDAPVVQVGQASYYDSATAHLCFRCVKAALDELTRPD